MQRIQQLIRNMVFTNNSVKKDLKIRPGDFTAVSRKEEADFD